MKLDTEALLRLLPAIYRIRDEEAGRDQALASLLGVIAEQVQVLQEDLAQLYDDQFVETCAEWVVPYIGDLVGYRALYGVTDAVRTPRAEVANTIGLRRRKGTVAVLEALARDVTGWDARVAEFFQRLGTTQFLNHVRPQQLQTPNLRSWEPLERLGGAFDSNGHTADVRSFGAGGRHNLPNVGVFFWRLKSHSLTAVPAFRVDEKRYLFNPLGANTPLCNRPVTPAADGPLVGPLNLPMPISRRVLDSYKNDYYGQDKALFIEGIDASRIVACNLADVDAGGSAWAHVPPAGSVGIDPVLGRIAFAEPPAAPPLVSFRYALAADLGGGEYDRLATLDTALTPIVLVPSAQPTLQAALAAVTHGGAVEISDGASYLETPSVQLAAGARVELRAADHVRPLLQLNGELVIQGGDGAELSLNGLVISGGPLRVVANSDGQTLRTLRLSHCTLVPGIALQLDGSARSPGAPSLIVETAGTEIVLDHCVTGPLAVAGGASVSINASIVDAGGAQAVAYAALDHSSAGAPLQTLSSTLIGRVHTIELVSASNSIFLAQANPADAVAWLSPIWSERRQDGCVRFCYLPFESRVPKRYRCQPASADDASRVTPMFNTLRYGSPSYAQLARRTAREILQGAEDGSELGAFHDLFQAQRETNANLRLTEFLPVRLSGGLLFES